MRLLSILPALLLLCSAACCASDPPCAEPQTVIVRSGALELSALFWRPEGEAQYPGVLFNHGSGRNYELQASTLGPIFCRHGYAFLFLFRRGTDLSADQGSYLGELLDRELEERGEQARNSLQLRLLETDHLSDVQAGLELLRALPQVDARRLALVGHSFGGSLALLAAERDHDLRAVVDFAGAANSWPRSSRLRERLIATVAGIHAPVFIIHAANDYSVAPAAALQAEFVRLGKPHRVSIYPSFGRSADDGHNFVYLSPASWEADVFAFLDENVRR